MKKYASITCLLVILLTGCYKDKTDIDTYTVPFTILHAISSMPDLLVVTENNRTSFNEKAVLYFHGDDGINVTGIWSYGLSAKEPSLIQVYMGKDSTKPFFSKLVDPTPNLRHNLLVTGTKEHPEVLYLDDLPPAPTDSSAGIRFVNLSPGLDHISINIAGQSPGSEVADLPYLQPSSFKKYNARANSNQYVFEMVDKSTGEIILTYPFTLVPFTNTNICLRGLKNGFPELQVTSLYQ